MTPRIAFAAALVATGLLVAGCAGGADRAREHYLAEAGRDLAAGPLDRDAAIASGQRIVDRAAEVAKRETLTLTDCFVLALANDDRLKLRGERILQGEMQEREAIGAFLPRIAGRGQYVRDSDEIEFAGGGRGSPQSRTEHWVTVEQTLFDGRILPALEVARAGQRIEALQLRDERDRLFFEVSSAFYEAKSLERDIAALEASLAGAVEHLRVLGVQQEAGEAQPQDVLLTQARRDEVQAELVQAQHDVLRARTRLTRLVGLPIGARPLADTLTVEAPPGEIPHLVDLALAQRHDLARADAQIDQAEAQSTAAATEFLPRASLRFDDWTRREGFSEDIDWTLTIGVDWTFFDGGAREARIARARSVVRERELALRDLEKEARRDVEDAVLAFRSLDRAMAAFESRARAAAESADQMHVRFVAGDSTNLDVLFAQEAREEAERNLARAIFARKLAALRIRLAIGDMRLALRDPQP